MTRYWYCASCDAEAKTVDGSMPMHRCKGIAGLTSPLILRGTSAKIETRERDDYVGSELVQTDANGRPIMSTVTTRDDGQDCTVYVTTAQARKE